MPLLIALLEVAAGFVLLIWAADRLVTGASALARNLGVPHLLIGLTIVGFGTSAPEMLVSAIASYRGNPSLAIGNAIGSNIANVALILGLTAMIYPLQVERLSLKREFPILGVIMVGTLALMWNGAFSWQDGVILIIGLMLLIALMIYLAIRTEKSDPAAEALVASIPEQMSTGRAVFWSVIGVLLLPLSAHVLVGGAVELAMLLGVSDVVIGLTIVALGTSLPELAAAAASAVKKEDDLCIGNILGSNMFNLLGVLGIAALVHPMSIEPVILNRDMPVMFITFAMLAYLAYRHADISRPDAALLFVCYLAYQAIVIVPAVTAQG